MTLRVSSGMTNVVIDLNAEATLVVDKAGLRVVMETGGMRVEVCDLSRAEAHELSELLKTALANT